jgi:hypothetical protein
VRSDILDKVLSELFIFVAIRCNCIYDYRSGNDLNAKFNIIELDALNLITVLHINEYVADIVVPIGFG